MLNAKTKRITSISHSTCRLFEFYSWFGVTWAKDFTFQPHSICVWVCVWFLLFILTNKLVHIIKSSIIYHVWIMLNNLLIINRLLPFANHHHFLQSPSTFYHHSSTDQLTYRIHFLKQSKKLFLLVRLGITCLRLSCYGSLLIGSAFDIS